MRNTIGQYKSHDSHMIVESKAVHPQQTVLDNKAALDKTHKFFGPVLYQLSHQGIYMYNRCSYVARLNTRYTYTHV